jgi:hypothetical protein
MGSGIMTSSVTSSATPQPEIDAGDDWLDDMLRDAGREHRDDYLADEGFAQRVMVRLPEAATLPAWRRPVVGMLWVLAVGAVMFSLPGVFEELFRGAVAVFTGHRLGLPDIAAALVLFGGLAWSTLVYAMRSD